MANRFDIDTSWRKISGVFRVMSHFTSVYAWLIDRPVINKVSPIAHFLTLLCLFYGVKSSVKWTANANESMHQLSLQSNMFFLFAGRGLHFLQWVEGHQYCAEFDTHKNVWWLWRVITRWHSHHFSSNQSQNLSPSKRMLNILIQRISSLLNQQWEGSDICSYPGYLTNTSRGARYEVRKS